MFSSLASRVSSSIRKSSPKAILASYLAEALSNFFLVDPELIESNLLSDTKIVLHDIRLKPQILTQDRKLIGNVDEITFSWTWGGNDETKYIRDTCLAIRGTHVRIVAWNEDGDSNLISLLSSSLEASPQTNITESSKTNTSSYIQRHIQQIMDHLTLHIENFDLSIETSEAEFVTFHANKLELVSFGRQDVSNDEAVPPLSQRITLESFCAHVVSKAAGKEEQEKLPLLDPFGYSASIKRVSGRRFLDGLSIGLEVVGEINQEAHSFTIHAGAHQVRALNQLTEILLKAAEDSHIDAHNNDMQHIVEEDMQRALREQSEAADQATPPSTSFVMPLPSVALLLPNETSIRTPGCTFQYSMDGSSCSFRGSQGITVNDDDFVRLMENAEWFIDFAASTIAFQKDAANDASEHWDNAAEDLDEPTFKKPLIAVLWKEHVMKGLISGFLDIANLADSRKIERVEAFYESEGSATLSRGQKSWSLDIDGALRLKLEGEQGDEWIEAIVGCSNAKFSVSDEMTLDSFRIDGIFVGPTSFGKSSLTVPAISMESGSNMVVHGGAIEAQVTSTTALLEIKEFLLRAFDIDSRHSESSSTQSNDIFPRMLYFPEIKLDVCEPQAKVLVKEASLEGSTAKCAVVQFTQSDGMEASASDIVATVTRDSYRADFARVNALSVPGVFNLADPVTDLAVFLEDGVLSVSLGSARIRGYWLDTEETKEQLGETLPETSVNLPFPVHMQLSELTVHISNDRVGSVLIRPIDVLVVPGDGVISIDSTNCLMSVRLEMTDADWLEWSVSNPSFVLGSSGLYPLRAASVEGMHVASCSYGVVSLGVPSLEMRPGSKELCVDGTISVFVQSLETADRIQSLLNDFILANDDRKSPTFPFRVMLPEVTVQLLEPDLRLTAHTLRCEGNGIHCERIILNESSGMSASCSSTQMSIVGPNCDVEVQWIESLYVPGVVALEKPTHGASIKFDNQEVHVHLPAVWAIMLQSNSTGAPVGTSSNGELAIPIRTYLSIQDMSVKISSCDGDTVKLHRLEANARPNESKDGCGRSGADFTIMVGRVENKLMRLENVGMSGLLFDQTIRTVHRFCCSASNAVVVAGFSSVDWSNMLGESKNGKTTVVELPFSRIGSLNAHLSFSGTVVATRDSVFIPQFQGSEHTTSEHLIQHICGAVLSKFPSILSNIEVFGENIFEMSGKSAGRMALASSMTGSAVGSVIGLAAIDGVKGAVASGKASRKASKDDRYHFGDFSRGLANSTIQASKAGAESRRGYSDGYVPGDFTVGASKSIVKYTSENKARLGAAGTSGVGMVVGSAIAGPLGFVVGGYIGSKLGEKALSGSESQQGAPTSSEVDLLGLNEACTVSPANQGQSAPSELDLLDAGTGSGATRRQSFSVASQNTGDDEWEKMMGQPVSATKFGTSAPVMTVGAETTPKPADADWECLMGLNQSAAPISGPPITANCPSTKCVPNDSQIAPSNTTPTLSEPPSVQMRGRYAPSTRRYESDTTGGMSGVGPHAPLEQKPSSEYHFGDITKSIVSKGKKKAGRDDSSGYKFGDFTRGLFG